MPLTDLLDLRLQSGIYHQIFDELSEAIIGTDKNGTIVLCNRATAAIFGWSPDELMGQPLDMLIPDHARKAHAGHMEAFTARRVKARYMGKASRAINGVHRDGHHISLDITIMRMAASPKDNIFVAVVRDITERMDYTRQIEKLANTDALTGLLNRRHFLSELAHLKEQPGIEDDGFWLGIFDLDGFKAINDVYGHHCGDLLLKDVASRIAISLPDRCLAARMGGDEFAIAIPGPFTQDDIDLLGQRIIEALRQPFFIDGAQISVSASGGFASFPDMAQTVSGLYERADFSLYSLKKARSGGISVFSPNFESRIEQKSRIEHCLRRDDLENELFLEYQPIVELSTNRITHFEALARWANPELGLVAPSLFVPLAERCGKIQDMTRLLFRKALDAAKAWPEDVSLSFNLSAQDILSMDSVFHLLRMIMRSGVAPARVEFEITETSILTDFDQADRALRNLAAAGCRISLDDFGSGYSSYGYMDRLTLHKIKMDRSFVSRLNTGPKALKVIRAIAEFATSLDLDCVAEGVETQNELENIRSVNIPLAQGYVFSRPVSESAIARMLKERRIISAA